MRELLLVAVLVSSAVASAQSPTPTPPPAPKAGTAGKEFNGVWSPTSVQHGGVEMMPTAEARASIRLSVTSGVYSLFYVVDSKEGTGRRLAIAAFDTDPKAGTFTLTFQGGVKNGQKVHGVYELKGDELKVCYTPNTNPSPTKFESAKGSDVFFETWKRVQK